MRVLSIKGESVNSKIFVVIAVLCGVILSATIPPLSEPEVLLETPGYYPSPEFVDWDGDGVTDLLIGGLDVSQQGMGFIWFLKNEGTNKTPKYVNKGKLLADGVPLETFGSG